METTFQSADSIRQALQYLLRWRGHCFVVALEVESASDIDITWIQNILLLCASGVQVVLVLGVLPNSADAAMPTDSAECITRNLASLIHKLNLIASPVRTSALHIEYAVHYLAASTSQSREAMTSLETQQHIAADTVSGKLVIVPAVSTDDSTHALSFVSCVAEVAAAVSPHKVVFCLERRGIRDLQNDAVLLHVHPQEVLALLAENRLDNGLAQIAPLACRLVSEGVPRAHIISRAQVDGLLVELFTPKGVGAIIYQGPYRVARLATHGDIGGIVDLISVSAESGAVRRKTADEVTAQINSFYVVEIDGRIVACACLELFVSERKAFVGSVSVAAEYQGDGIGSSLIGMLEQQAKAAGAAQLTLASPQTSSWWIEHGYHVITTSDLPEAIRPRYIHASPNTLFCKAV